MTVKTLPQMKIRQSFTVIARIYLVIWLARAHAKDTKMAVRIGGYKLLSSGRELAIVDRPKALSLNL